MKLFLLPFLLLAPLALRADLEIFYVDSAGTEHAISNVYNLGSVAVGETLDSRLRVRNPGVASVTISTLQAAGAAFSTPGAPSLPYVLAPASALDVTVRFQPTAASSYSANFQVNSIAVILSANARLLPVVMLNGSILSSGTLVDWGAVQRGTAAAKTFTILNLSAASATVSVIAVSSGYFQAANLPNLPATLDPNQSLSFNVIFQPTQDGAQQGTLTVDNRTFPLTGMSVAPPLPQPQVAFDASSPASAQQVNVRIQLSQVASSSGSGTLTLAFHPAPGTADDPAIQFLPSGRRLTFTVNQGDSIGHFSSQDFATFQTGATAGEIVFTAQLGGNTDQASYLISPALVQLSPGHVTRNVNSLALQITGFDNTWSATMLSFTFYDSKGNFAGSGAIRVDATTDFQHYFSSSTVGGTFLLNAVFPVSGGTTSITSVGVTVANSVGTSSVSTIQF